ncbi:ABC-type transport [Acidisarcina polymorpha]|uniref:ABC-type transport n=1 Tax=Acidisarcina polymorpha TaxID=2211140 RepID=A0A2Z5G0C3_9BACT|nr:MlaD family protein [Acidisarcina polymorpha]AXC12204.1 ABC-type transport [Acidisarcina polymorpha]
MKPYRGAVAAFLILGVILFGIGLFLVGDQHKAFSHHLDFYTDLADVDGLNSGAHVRVNGFEAGEITKMEIPQKPTGKFRLKLHIDGKLKSLIRTDSVVTVETDGLVGDKFLLIHSGSETAQLVPDGGTIRGREPVELSAILQKVSGTVDQANTTIVDIRTRLDGTLDSIKNTVDNTNGIVTGIRQGHGPVGALLNDQQITSDLKSSLANTRVVTANLNQVSVQAGQVMADFQSRGLIAKADQSIDNIRHASKGTGSGQPAGQRESHAGFRSRRQWLYRGGKPTGNALEHQYSNQ